MLGSTSTFIAVAVAITITIAISISVNRLHRHLPSTIYHRPHRRNDHHRHRHQIKSRLADALKSATANGGASSSSASSSGSSDPLGAKERALEAALASLKEEEAGWLALEEQLFVEGIVKFYSTLVSGHK